ncbi:MAG: RHS repeat-associated core domain-containing protein, partial [Oceanisphaera sp.]|uniref:RHS repeat-associated core domain-containing protein n=1 Tax=Oceanisphaera sp. TaxID=1929979 RepID=UPI003C73B39B
IGQLTDINSQASLIGKDNTVQQHIRNHHYQYDAIGRLTQHKLAGSNTSIIEQFAFDPAGNRVSTHNSRIEDTNKQTQTATRKPQGRPTELISQGKHVRYSYDSHGRVINKTTTANALQSSDNLIGFQKELTFKYNANNELRQTILTHHKGSETIVTTTDYYYDAFGRRIHKHSQISQGKNTQDTHTHMLWDGDKAIQEHTDTHVYNTIYDQGSFSPVARLVWPKDGLQQAANDDSDSINSGKDSKAIQVYHYHNDPLGTPNELTNSQGEVVWLADYEAWGNTAKVVWREQTIEQMQVSTEELQPIRFQGQHFDVETGLHYNRFRYYDADMGMFTTRDPIGLYGGLNVFAYAPNPTGWIDPLGLVSREEAITSLENDSSVQPKIPARQRIGQRPGRSAQYSRQQINERWSDMYEADIEQNLKAGNMLPCPSSRPTSCTSCAEGSGGWKEYGGNSNVFHCGFKGVLENRVPSEKNPAPANECFYDNSGALVDESHKWKGCRGTPDYYPYFGTGTAADEARKSPHATKDAGGTLGPSKTHFNLSAESLAESADYHASIISETVSGPPTR